MNITKNLRVFLGTCAVTLLIGATTAQAFSLVREKNSPRDVVAAQAFSLAGNKGWTSYKGCDAQSPNYLMNSYGLRHGACLVSPNGTAIAIYKKNGNFVIYRGSAMGKPGGSNKMRFLRLGERKNKVIIWTSDTWKRHGNALVMLDDGNLVNYHGENAIWSAGGRGAPGYLVLGDNAQLVLHTSVNGMRNWGPEVKGLRDDKFFPQGGNMRQFISGKSKWDNDHKVISRGSGEHAVKGVYVTNFHRQGGQSGLGNVHSDFTAANTFVNSNCSGKEGVTQKLTGNLKLAVNIGTKWGNYGRQPIGMAEIGSDALVKLKVLARGAFLEAVTRGKMGPKTYAKTVSLTVEPQNKQSVHLRAQLSWRSMRYDGYWFVDGNHRKAGAKISTGYSPILTRTFSRQHTLHALYVSSTSALPNRPRKCDLQPKQTGGQKRRR